mgnify:FL=1
MLKKYFLLIFFLFLSACGYQAIHSKKNSINFDFSITKLNFVGEREINLIIEKKLNNYTLIPKNKNYGLKISSFSEKTILVKNISGDPTSFKNTLTLNVEVLTEKKIFNDFQIVESFIYNNTANKFDLKRYEKEIKSNLAETVTDKLILMLSSIQ